MYLLTRAYRHSLAVGRSAGFWCIIVLSLLLGCSPYSKEIRNGSNYMMRGDNDLAIIEFNHAIEKNPKNAVAYYDRGVAYFIKEQFDKAIADLDKVLELAKHHISSNASDGSAAYGAYSDFAKMAEMDRAAKIGVGSPSGFAGALGALGFGGFGQSKTNQDQEDLGIALAPTALRIRTSASWRKAKLYEETGHIPEALAAYTEYIAFYKQLEPNQQEQPDPKDMYHRSVEKVEKLKTR